MVLKVEINILNQLYSKGFLDFSQVEKRRLKNHPETGKLLWSYED